MFLMTFCVINNIIMLSKHVKKREKMNLFKKIRIL